MSVLSFLSQSQTGPETLFYILLASLISINTVIDPVERLEISCFCLTVRVVPAKDLEIQNGWDANIGSVYKG